MDWHSRFKKMKIGLGYTNSDIAEITGNTTDSIKSSTQPNKEIPRWLKLSIVVYEDKLSKHEAELMLNKQSKEDIYDFIRQKLAFDDNMLKQFKHIDSDKIKKEHRRFEMSGYESKKGESTLSNLSIVNEFAYLGIYNSTSYLFLDFYKGTPTLYLKYFHSEENIELDLSGLGTVDIIYEIFEMTIFSDNGVRRR